MKSNCFARLSNGANSLVFGGGAISGEGGGYGFGAISTEQSLKLIDYVFSRGINVFDTAPIYGFGESERRLGQALKKVRDKVAFISKSGVSWHANKRVDMNNDPKIALKMLHTSLTDLQTDYIDLYMVHWPDSKWDIRKTLEVYAKAQQQQKIIDVGLCNTTVEELQKAKEVVDVKVVQSQLNFFERKVSEELFDYLQAMNIDFMSWGTLDKGILTGRVHKSREFDVYDCRRTAPWWDKKEVASKVEFCQNKLFSVLEKFNITPTTFALGFNFHYPEVSMVVCGGRSIEQWEQLITSYQKLPSKKIIESILAHL